MRENTSRAADGQLDHLKKLLGASDRDLASKRADLISLRGEIAAKVVELQDMERHTAALEAEIDRCREQIAGLEADNAACRALAVDRAAEIGELRDHLATMALTSDNALRAWEARETEVREQRRTVARLGPKAQSNRTATAALDRLQRDNAELRGINAELARDVERLNGTVAELRNRSFWSRLRSAGSRSRAS